MEEFQFIREIQTVDAAKHKRGYRRGRITKTKAIVEECLALSLGDLRLDRIDSIVEGLAKDIRRHDALQERFEQILERDTTMTEEAWAEELQSAENHHDSHQDILRQARALRSNLEWYLECEEIRTEFARFESKANPDVPEYETEGAKLQQKLQLHLAKARGSTDAVVVHERADLQGQLDELQVLLDTSRKSRAKVRASASSGSSSETKKVKGPKIRLDMPTFSGEPSEWAHFYELFTSAVDRDDGEFSERQKACLLEKAMLDPEAQAIVKRLTHTSNGYEKGMKALIKQYGSDRKVFPVLVKRTLQRAKIEFDQSGFKELRERIYTPFQSMQDQGCSSLTQYLATLVTQDFSPKFSEEWMKYAAALKGVPTVADLMSFTEPLEHAGSSISESQPSEQGTKKPEKHSTQPKKSQSASNHQAAINNRKCGLCHETHKLFQCPVFLGYDASRRISYVKDKKGCTNCLSMFHQCHQCPSAFTCKTCNGKHNTLLHREDSSSANTTRTPAPSLCTVNDQQLTNFTELNEAPPRFSFLHTAIARAVQGDKECKVRAALDSGSSSSLITEAVASHLRLKRYPQRVNLKGAHGDVTSKHFIKLTLRSCHDETKFISASFTVVPSLPAANPPNRCQDIISAPHVKGLCLADPDLGGSLDILLGGLDMEDCILGSRTKGKDSDIYIQPTIFGWTVAGPMDYDPEAASVLRIQSSEDTLSNDLALIWELEKTPEGITSKPVEDPADQHFSDTHQVAYNGRYIVKLPRIEQPPELGASRNLAAQRYLQNEKSLKKKDKLEEFLAALREYITLGHAEYVPQQELSFPHYYLPVHGVFKDSSTTTKVRPVFDASARTSNGVSLNDTLLPGPNNYPLLTDILIRFRQHRIGFSADISKMFREVLLHPTEKDYHRFLLRELSTNQIKDCRMTRVTFGVRSSPFLATKVIRDLAIRHKDSHPEASKAILTSFYVDDYVAGAESVEEASYIRQQLCELLNLAGMKLRKWRASDSNFRNTIPSDLVEMEDLKFVDTDQSLKALGVHWDVRRDSLHIAAPELSANEEVTKRKLSSAIGRVFDVLGFFAPYTITAKILLRKAWSTGISWDTPLPDELQASWETWRSELSEVTNISIPRRHHHKNSAVIDVALHGFSDASSEAYGAVVYLRQTFEDLSTNITIIISKARVLPLKGVTTPRAELTGALLLTKLLKYVADLLHINNITAWTDSAIVLCWLRKLPSILNAYVGHRISAIQELIPNANWRHIPSKQNPADMLSRGTSINNLRASSMWWHGPQWLRLPMEQWPTPQFEVPNDLPEVKSVTLISPPPAIEKSPWEDYSSFSHLTRIYSWVRRFIFNCQPNTPQLIRDPHLTTEEIHKTRNFLFRLSQKEQLNDVIKIVKSDSSLPKAHYLSKYDVSLDEDGMLYITGRVRDPRKPTTPRRQIPLSLKSYLVRLFVETQHKKQLHAGTNTMLAILGAQFNIPSLRNFLKGLSRRCADCQRVYAHRTTPQMGLLPSIRTTPSAPFSITGLDFAGPFDVKKGQTRKPVHVKAYICLFICLSTKAIHLEVCSDLSTEEFMAALRRFCARRGTPTHIMSDNGSNFIGAANEIDEIKSLIARTSQSRSHFCGEVGIKWSFIPPRTPNFGGLWESGVKMTKILMRKVVGPHSLRLDELTTILVEIEAILNSRPLAPLHSTDADELVLTPGHFLIGRPLLAPPSKNAESGSITSLRRWKLVQRLTQDFWDEWKGNYLNHLDARAKWQRHTPDPRIGDVVYVKEETVGYRRLPLGRISATYPGDDGRVRVVDVKTQGKTLRRSTSHLIPVNINSPPPVCSGPTQLAAGQQARP